ncbi:hypothetical protein MIMGU_mgv1a007442mg [Erythranthe guttata]|uniref:GTP cyclohydrolase 1 n=1 Tax=Erythranthe guttata TaxID=4155 RepID=A0A022RKV4_ERYGU|nr:hypothetical protein MIMGU_mgv1a007442mg [Erythranthe guttata]
MGALDEGHYNAELGNGVNLGGDVELDFDEEPDTFAIEEAVRVLLQGLGEDFNREGLKKTPLRVAKALLEGTRGYKQNVKDIVGGALFPEAGLENKVGHAGGTGGLVLVRDLDLFSYCESCLLPFQVKCHVGYVPSAQRVVGLSKLSRVAETLVKSGSGVFDDDMSDIWTDFLSLLRFRGVNVGDVSSRSSGEKCWCPSHAFSNIGGSSDSKILSSVSSILCSLGEDPLRKELVETPARFVKWLMNFKNSKFETKLNGHIHNIRGKTDSLISHEDEHLCCEVNLSFLSQCEHHLLPFHGVVHIGYYRSNGFIMNPVGKSILQSIVRFYGFKLQVQERLTRQIAETVSSYLGEDVMVVVEASHTCMISRGIEKFGSNTATIAVLGRFSTDPLARAKFLQIIPNSCPGEN